MKRRQFLGHAAKWIGASAIAAAPVAARAQSAVDRLLQNPKLGSWNDQFDAQKSVGPLNTSNTPIFSSRTPALIEQAIQEYRGIVGNGGWPVVPANQKLELGATSRNVPLLRQRLAISGDLDATAGQSEVYDTWVTAAVKRFQARHGLPPDGVMGKYTFAAMNIPAGIRLGQLETNLARLRSMDNIPAGGRYVMVNIPAAQIEAVENGRVVLRHTAIVGKIDRQTPILDSKIHEVILNPFWTAPKSIIQKDIIPLMRKDPSYLERNNIRVFNEATGEEIPISTIDWNTDDAVNYMLRQDPGKINAMASTKINFYNQHAVYMHDTPQQSLFGNIERFNSSGCVRVQNVRDLVTWLLRDTPGWNRTAIERGIASGQNTEIEVTNPVPLFFTYITAWSTEAGVVNFRDDIYRRDGVEELALGTGATL
ncbi:MAG: L,D-transpeptidase family protein [Nitratireductor sp.]|nr:L,D-transpeptidase family protein [Nitratireductor sp.]